MGKDVGKRSSQFMVYVTKVASTVMSLFMYLTLNKYNCKIANKRHEIIILNGQIDLLFLPTCAKTQSTAIYTPHVKETAAYGDNKKYAIQLHIYAAYVK